MHLRQRLKNILHQLFCFILLICIFCYLLCLLLLYTGSWYKMAIWCQSIFFFISSKLDRKKCVVGGSNCWSQASHIQSHTLTPTPQKSSKSNYVSNICSNNSILIYFSVCFLHFFLVWALIYEFASKILQKCKNICSIQLIKRLYFCCLFGGWCTVCIFLSIRPIQTFIFV